jgi:RHS repeat-associated protein
LADPFGVTPPTSDPSGVGVYTYNLRLPGQTNDRESNLFQNWHRNYDPVTGRYIESDPIGLGGGLNTYAYVEGNPLTGVDPAGLEIEYANHEVGLGFYHSKIVITPDNQAAYANDPRFQNFDENGRRFATIGAGPNEYLRMEAGVNRPRDVSMPDATRSKLDLPCNYANEDEAIKNLFRLAENYNKHKTGYALLPRNVFGIPTGYNSNSFVSGLGRAAGFNMPAPSATGQNTPGYQNALPAWRFGP